MELTNRRITEIIDIFKENIELININSVSCEGKNTEIIKENLKDNFEAIKAMQEVIPILEMHIKQSPPQKIFPDDRFLAYVCPHCESSNIRNGDKFCKECGQALDWEWRYEGIKDLILR